MHGAKAVVIKIDCITGLQTSRALSDSGIGVIGIADNPNHFSCKTNSCESIVQSITTNEELVKTLIELGRSFETKPVLFPCSDESVYTISLHRNTLRDWYNFVLPEHNIIELLTQKETLYKHCIKNEFPLSATYFPQNRRELYQIAKDITYPCVLKPKKNDSDWKSIFSKKVIKIENEEVLYNSLELCFNSGITPVLQEWIEGSESNIYQCYMYFDKEHNPIISYVSRKLRQWPTEMGDASLVDSTHCEPAMTEALKFFSSLKFRGLTSLEIKIDEKNGQCYIIEPDVSRPNTSIGLLNSAGIPILYTLYCDALGLPLRTNVQKINRTVKWISIHSDILSSWIYFKSGKLSFWDWAKSVYGVNSFAVLSISDPMPFLTDFLPFIRILSYLTHKTKNVIIKLKRLIKNSY